MAIPPMEGTKPTWIFLPPGTSIMFPFFKKKITTGVIKNPKKNEVAADRKMSMIICLRKSNYNIFCFPTWQFKKNQKSSPKAMSLFYLFMQFSYAATLIKRICFRSGGRQSTRGFMKIGLGNLFNGSKG